MSGFVRQGVQQRTAKGRQQTDPSSAACDLAEPSIACGVDLSGSASVFRLKDDGRSRVHASPQTRLAAANSALAVHNESWTRCSPAGTETKLHDVVVCKPNTTRNDAKG